MQEAEVAGVFCIISLVAAVVTWELIGINSGDDCC